MVDASHAPLVRGARPCTPYLTLAPAAIAVHPRSKAVNLAGLTADGQNLARQALQTWSEITGLNFSEVLGTAQINFSDETGPVDGGAWTESFFDENDHFTTAAYVNVDVAWLTGEVERQAKLVQHGTLKIYPGYPHGMLTTHADVINPDLLAFVKG